MIKKFFKDITGITAKEEAERLAREQAFIEAEAKKQAAAARRKAKQEKAIEANLSPKDIATKRKEPWVDVTGFKVNQDNIRNGFYELDWNEYFIDQLKKEGYGYDGDPDEEIVSRWFRDICINAAAQEGIDMTDRAAGYINVTKLTGGKAEVK
jgi:hypothetical protein